MKKVGSCVLFAVAVYFVCSLGAVGQTLPISEARGLARWDGTNRVAFYGYGFRRAEDGPIRGYVAGKRRGSDIFLFKDFPGLRNIVVDDIAAGANGSTVLAVFFDFGPNQLRNAILTYSESGQLVRVLDTSPYYPNAIAVDTDGSIYMIGHIPRNEGIKTPYPLLIHYSARGEIIRSSLPSSAFSAGAYGIDDDELMKAVLVKRDEQLLLYAPAAREVLACSPDGNILRRTSVSDMIKQVSAIDRVGKTAVKGIGFLDSNTVILDLQGYTDSQDGHIRNVGPSALYRVDLKSTLYSIVGEKTMLRKWLLLGAIDDEVVLLARESEQVSFDFKTLEKKQKGTTERNGYVWALKAK